MVCAEHTRPDQRIIVYKGVLMRVPKISVIVPVYNVEKYIAECLDSLITQTLRDIEIICVDDCSTDESVKIIRRYIKRDNRIKLVCKKVNSGLSDSRNIGVAKSVAPYLMFCDSDDFYSPDMCEKMLNAICKHGVDLAVCSMNVIYESDSQLKSSDDQYYSVKYDGVVPVDDAVIKNCDVSACSKIFKRKILDRYNIRFPSGLKYEDAYFFNVYVLWVKKISFVRERLYNYRRRAGSIMNRTFSTIDNGAIDHLKIAIKYFEYLYRYNLYDKKMDFFWCNIFIPLYLCAVTYGKSKSVFRQITEITRDFINKNYKWHSLDLVTERKLMMIMDGTLGRSKKYLFGLLRKNANIDAMKLRLCGVPIYVEKFVSPTETKRYICGICIK